MADKTVQLAITADASGVEAGVGKAEKSLKSLGATAQAAGDQAGKGLDKVGAGGDKAAKGVASATRNLETNIQRQIAAGGGERGSRAYFEALANQRGVSAQSLKPLLDQLDAAKAKQEAANVALRGGNAALNATGISAKQTAAALRQVPAQFTDIITSLQAGQSPLQVLLQQGGQLKDVFGGVGAAAQALGRYVLSLVTPFSVLATVLGSVVAGAYAGSQELANINRALILTGNQAGVTAGSISGIAESIDAIAGTQGKATEVLLELSSSGRVGAANLERFALAAIQLERVGGPAASETAKAFAELGKSPLQAAVKLNEATGFLTRSVYEQIKALEEQGRTVEAARVAQNAYASELENRVPKLAEQLGLLEKAWKNVKDATAEAWDFLKSVGREQSPVQRLASLQNDLLKIGAPGTADYDKLSDRQKAFVDSFRKAKDQELAALNRQLLLESEVAAQQRLQTQQVEDTAAADKELERLGIKRLTLAEQEVALRRKLIAGGKDEATIQKAIIALREKNTDKPRRGGKTPEFSASQIDTAAIERDLRTLTGAYANAESILAAQRQAGLVSEADYYEARRAFIRINTDAQVEALRAENDLIQASISSGKLKADEATRQAEKIKNNVSKIQEIEAKAAAQTAILGIQQTSAINSVSRAYKEAQQSAQDYLDTLQRNQRRELELMGMSDAARQRSEGRQRIEDQYAAERRRVENERNLLSLQQGGNLTSDQQKRFDDLLAINEDFQAKALASYEQYTKDRIALEVDWSVGAQRAVAQYLEEAQNIARQTEDAFANAFRGMEDALVDFIRTGKLDFKSLADSIVADIARIIVKQQLSKAIGLVGEAGASSSGEGGWGAAAAQFFGSLFGGGRAIGGPVQAGGLYRVNERGPELLKVAGEQYLMMGSQGGEVQAAPRQSAPAQVLTVNVQMPQGANRQTAQQFGVEIGRQLQLATTRNG